ncbi:MAG: acetate--CoA ligase family protein, partial [Bacteroidales bacterium]
MINEKLIKPGSIVVVGGSEDITKTGGKVLKNIIDGHFQGKLYVINPKSDVIQGIISFRDVSLIPECDLAIIAIPAKLCLPVVETLAYKKKVKSFIILSAGFGEESEEGRILEKRISEVVDSVGGTLLGPNCIGLLNMNYCGVFTTPIPQLKPEGVELISGSGATAVFIMEAAIPVGVPFSAVYSVGNSAQTGIEDILEFLDLSYIKGESSKVKLLYIESIRNPLKFLKHASSLVSKGCHIAGIKAGSSEAGIRAASSHTGAMASSDMAYDALLKKAGIVRCHSRTELIAVAAVYMNKLPEGKRIGIITHAGGPAVILTDVLSKTGIDIPLLSGTAAEKLRTNLFPGSSVSNPIDFLATGTAAQLEMILDACENDFSNIDAMAVIFGSPGLFPVNDVYDVIHRKIRSCKKPVYPVLPSGINAGKEINEFVSRGNIYFPDEAVFGNALASVLNMPMPEKTEALPFRIEKDKIRSIIESSHEGYLDQTKVDDILDASGIPVATRHYVDTPGELESAVNEIGFPVAMKAIGPLHKSETGGVFLNVSDMKSAEKILSRLFMIRECQKVIVQKMIYGTELYAGLTYEENFGHLLLAGLGGIFIEVLKDFSYELVPVTQQSALKMVKSLKGYQIIKGARGKEGVNEMVLVEIICRISELAVIAPEICELDLNPLIGTMTSIT